MFNCMLTLYDINTSCLFQYNHFELLNKSKKKTKESINIYL